MFFANILSYGHHYIQDVTVRNNSSAFVVPTFCFKENESRRQAGTPYTVVT